MKRALWPSMALVAVGVALAMLREFLVINLNYELHFREHRRAASYAHSLFKGWVQGWSTGQLHALKWGLALLFISANLLLCILMARVRAGDHRYRSAIVVGFLVVAAVALSAHLATPWITGARMFSLQLLHTLQYPVLLLLIWAASWLPRR